MVQIDEDVLSLREMLTKLARWRFGVEARVKIRAKVNYLMQVLWIFFCFVKWSCMY